MNELGFAAFIERFGRVGCPLAARPQSPPKAGRALRSGRVVSYQGPAPSDVQPARQGSSNSAGGVYFVFIIYTIGNTFKTRVNPPAGNPVGGVVKEATGAPRKAVPGSTCLYFNF